MIRRNGPGVGSGAAPDHDLGDHDDPSMAGRQTASLATPDLNGYAEKIIGEHAGALAVAFGIEPYWNAKGKYEHRRWEQRFYTWPNEHDKLRRDVEATSGKRVDVYVCPAVRYTRDRRKGTALPLKVLWTDLDGLKNEDLLTKLNPFIVESGSEGHRHAYLPLTEEVDPEKWQQLQTGLRDRLGGDAKIADNDLLRLPGTWNHKTVPPRPVQSLSWTGSPWDPDDLDSLLGEDLAAAPAKRRPACVVAEPPPDPLPPKVLDALTDRDVDDRSRAHHRVVGACRDAGLTHGQTATVVSEYPPSQAKYGDRLPEEVGRSWDKILPKTVLETGGASPSTSNTSNGCNGDLLAGVRSGAWLDRQVFPPLSYPIDGLIPEGYSMLIGPPKVGKSWLLAALLLARSSGGYALGKIQLHAKQPVFYLALEDGDRRMQSRARKILQGTPIPKMFHYITRVQPSRVIHTIDAFLV